MDYGYVLRRAWEITWRWRALWLLGLLAGLTRATNGGSLSYTAKGGDSILALGLERFPDVVGILVGLGCLALIVVVAIWVVSVIARGSLIAGVNQLEETGTTGLGAAWRVGAKYAWQLLAVSLLLIVPVVAMFIALALTAGVAIDGVVEGADRGGSPVGLAATLCAGTLCCGLFVVTTVTGQIRIYAERAAVLDDMCAMDAIKRGWSILKENLAPSIIIWLILFLIGSAIAVFIFLILLATFVPLQSLAANVDSGAWSAAAVCCGGLFAAAMGVLLGAILETYSSASWTLTYAGSQGKRCTSRQAKGRLLRLRLPCPMWKNRSLNGSLNRSHDPRR